MDDTVVCLGCGGIVGKSDGWGCRCPPPALQAGAVHPYRSAVATDVCPRCKSRLVEETYHDAICPTCVGCGGMFVSREVVMRLGAEDAAPLRLAFPRRDVGPEALSVRYLPCVVCKKLMNRTIFAHVSGVLVDVCKNDGVWFDAGEIGKTIAFIEAGGLRRSKAFETQRARQTAEADRRAWEKAREPVMTGSRLHDTYAEDYQSRLLLDALSTLFS